MAIIFRKGFRFQFIALFFLFSTFSYAQLSNFTLQVAAGDETCTGNGTLTFTVTGTVAGSSMDYTIYLLPNTSSPLATVTTNSYSGLNYGNYRVVATQSLNGNSGTQQIDVEIKNLIHPLTYSLTGTKVKCGNDGKITVTATSGSPATYQIISGPVIVPAQTSNVFSNLPTGVYQIKVFDTCGEAVVQTFTLLQTSVSLVIDPVTFPQTVLPTCNSILVSNFFGALTGSQIAFPLTFEYSIFPPGGGPPVVMTQIMNSGDTIEQIIPFYNNQSYFYNLKVTDACGTIYNKNNNLINKKFDVTLSTFRLNCTDIALKIAPSYFVDPYTINFLSFPAGFNPAAYNINHPGPFNSGFEIYGAAGNSFPTGTYSIQLTDACGRTAVKNITVAPVILTPTVTAFADGCGHIEISIPTIQLVSVIITAAPVGYSFPLPHNLSNLIDAMGQFNVFGLPEGSYTFQVTDSCNIVHTLQVTILPYQPSALFIVNRPGCEDGYGSLRLNSSEGIVSVSLMSAPAAYTGTVPADLTVNIDNGTFYLNYVPEGNYTFLLANNCGGQRTETIVVTGYHITTNTVTLTENCGSFNLFLQHISNGSFQQSFWLQKFNPITNTWGHPGTGSTYTNGTVPTNQNSILLYNNVDNLNFAYSGQFRIMKNFQTYPSQGAFVNCTREIYTFEILQGPKIINVYSFGCTSTNEVIVDAVGIPPLNYSITTKNGVPFVVNNGTQNLFSNLTPGIYNFQVQDLCGNIVNSLYDITAASPLVIEASAFCNAQNGSLSVSPFSFLTYEWWKDNNTTTILSTINTLQFAPFNQVTDAGIYHVRISNPNNTGSCINLVLDYEILPNLNNPNAGDGTVVTYCGVQGNVNLFTLLSGPYDSLGTWQEISSSGALNNNVWNSTIALPGTYQFSYRVNGLCNIYDEAVVTINLKTVPATPVTSVDGVVCDTHEINLTATSITDATYLWVGPNGFSSNVQNPIITNVSAQNNGIYSVKAIVDGCESEVSSMEVNVNSSPQFILEGFCDGNAFMIRATPISNSFNVDGVDYQWTGPNSFTSTENSIIATGAPGSYQLVVTTTAGCTGMESIMIANTPCNIPLGISPNGDSDNEEFDLSGFDVLKLEIFSRYGRLVYKQDNYTKQWHGQDYNNRELPAATYYYYLQLATGEEKTGWVYVTR